MYKHPVDHKLLIAVAKPVDRYGNQAAIEGKPVFALSDSSYGELTPSEDGLIAVFVPNGTPTPEGVAVQVVVTADADLGEGRKEITSRGEFALVAGEAVGLVIGFSDGGAF